MAALHALVGLREVKERCQNLKDAVELEKERGDDPKQRSYSLVVTGNPGTGKTTFAHLYSRLLGELKVLPTGRVVRITGAQVAPNLRASACTYAHAHLHARTCMHHGRRARARRRESSLSPSHLPRV